MMASEAEHQPQFLPPGFRFHPTDEELIQHYLRKRAAGEPCPVPIIAEVDIYKFNPWDLPSMAKQHHQQQGGDSYGCGDWYFFSPRDRKYPNGARPNRAAGSGYWKATGTDRPIVATSSAASGEGREGGRIGVKKALVFYKGKPPRGTKTNWIMHEYRLTDHQQPSQFYHVLHPVKNKDPSSMRLDDWVLCRIYEKTHNHQQSPGTPTDDQQIPGGVDDGALEDIHNNVAVLQQQPSTYPSGASTSSLDTSGSLLDILCGVDTAQYSMLSRFLFTTDNRQTNPPPDLRLPQQRHHSSAIIGQSPVNITSAINSESLLAGYFNSGNSIDSCGTIPTSVHPISGFHQWPPLPQVPPSSEAMATAGCGLKRQREPTDGFLGHTDYSVVTVLHPAKKELTNPSSGFTSTRNNAGSDSRLLPGYGNLLSMPSHFGTMDNQAYQLGHDDMLPNPKYLGLSNRCNSYHASNIIDRQLDVDGRKFSSISRQIEREETDQELEKTD